MDERLINAFIEPLQSILSTMAAVDATPRAPRTAAEASGCGEVTGVIDLTGRQANISFALTFTTSTILAIKERVLGEHSTQVDDEARDMVGEFTNMVTGGAKKRLGDLGYEFDMSVPTVMAAQEREAQRTAGHATTIVPFSTDCGDLCIEISLD